MKTGFTKLSFITLMLAGATSAQAGSQCKSAIAFLEDSLKDVQISESSDLVRGYIDSYEKKIKILNEEIRALKGLEPTPTYPAIDAMYAEQMAEIQEGARGLKSARNNSLAVARKQVEVLCP